MAALKKEKTALDFYRTFINVGDSKKRDSSLLTCISRHKTGSKSKPHQPT